MTDKLNGNFAARYAKFGLHLEDMPMAQEEVECLWLLMDVLAKSYELPVDDFRQWVVGQIKGVMRVG